MNKTAPRRKSFLYFFTIALVLSMIIFFMLMDSSKKYRSEVSVIFIPKSEKTALISEQITKNLEIVPGKLSFYKKLINENEEIKKSFSNFSDYRNNVKTKRENGSTIVGISATGKNSAETEKVAKTSALTLFNVFSHYYDIKSDIDLRIIDGPNTGVVYGNFWIILLFSLIIGTVLSILINFILDLISDYLHRNGDLITIRAPKFDLSKLKFPSVSIRKPIDERSKPKTKKPELQKTEIKKTESRKIEEKIKAKPAPIIASASKKSSAPENLPFIDEDYFRNTIIKSGKNKNQEPEKKIQTETLKTSDKVSEESKTSTDYQREPTQEELKKRLNKLLRGEL